MKAFLLCLVIGLACGGLFGRSEEEKKETERTPVRVGSCDCADKKVLTEVMVERDECEAKLEEAPAVEVKTRIQRVPFRCGDSPPEMRPVQTTKCGESELCLDTEAQLAMAANLADYAQWKSQYEDCAAKTKK